MWDRFSALDQYQCVEQLPWATPYVLRTPLWPYGCTSSGPTPPPNTHKHTQRSVTTFYADVILLSYLLLYSNWWNNLDTFGSQHFPDPISNIWPLGQYGRCNYQTHYSRGLICKLWEKWIARKPHQPCLEIY